MTKQVIEILSELKSDDLGKRQTVISKIYQKEIDVSIFQGFGYDFTTTILPYTSSLDKTTQSESLSVTLDWVNYLLTQPKVNIKLYDLCMKQFVSDVYYALNDQVETCLGFVVPFLCASSVFCTRHFSGLLKAVSFHSENHTLLIFSILKEVLSLVNRKVIFVPPLDWSALLVLLALLFHFSDISQQHEIIETLRGMERYNTTLTTQYISTFLKSCNIQETSLYEGLMVV
ncbi:hypothetical protein EIN_169540 [Entamoeba invadens IP1]|uniref:Uncharacterized protein n=1 Tax=Entamoeba invadens IP1 TaxID=370355 RepID=A0A0A1TVL7_ENTIV|nr:hypothetical protein EIN_169540 [Entamoeba invadens IP1]ELP84509.1 hypothetical protein EIN_169540 [Entamoeba invadens IP1]|eukprot:XP_004183855.1 hypothetical protein EIN_169540 [Entamoeba invadens IP1]